MLEARSDMDSVVEAESHSLVEELKQHCDLIADAFLEEDRYAINVLQFRNVRSLIRMDILTRDFTVDFCNPTYKTFLVLQLKIESYKRAMETVDMRFVLEALDASFTHRENTLLHSTIYPFLAHVLKGTNTIYVHQICSYLIPRLYSFFVEHWAQEEGPKPFLSNLFPFLLDVYGLLLDLIVQWGLASKKMEGWDEVLVLFKEWESPDWNSLRAGFLNRSLRRESLKYTNTKDVSEWLEDCISEPFLRYLCHQRCSGCMGILTSAPANICLPPCPWDPELMRSKAVPMDSGLKENILLALCGLDASVPPLPLPFEGLVAKHNKLAALNDYGLGLRLSDLYKRVSSSRHATLEEIYLMYEKELESIEKWCEERLVCDVAAEHNECALNAAAKRFVETGSALNSELVVSEHVTGFDMCEWNNKFSLKKLCGTEAGNLILSCGKMVYFKEMIARTYPHHMCRRCTPDDSGESTNGAHMCSMREMLRHKELPCHSESSGKSPPEEHRCSAETSLHAKDCRDAEHRFVRAGFLAMAHYMLSQDFHRALFPLISNEMHKIYKFVFLRDSSRIADFMIIFDKTGELSSYPFRLRFDKHTLKGKIFKILDRDVTDTATLVELVTIEIDTVLRHFVSEKTFGELELIFRYLFSFTYLQYYLRKTSRRVLLSVVIQLINSYQIALFPVESTNVEECLLNLDAQIKKALGIFGMTGNSILDNLKFIDAVMGYIFGSKELSEVLMLARQVDFQGVLHSVDWNMLSMHEH
ncbi:UNVERIFIED_CONTAM: hypothetical protein PYX00_011711 [Menopon gallinae]|uniref:RING-type E3 ubiquitin transferase n=1 Tax=Menopon gallinae TaxID=328185 RepID=A0AAW2H871_9NEOP